jgi:hypothetical protein
MSQKQMHLYRGAPCVRSWSQHKETVKGWTLCGIRREKLNPASGATENEALVTCAFCRRLAELPALDARSPQVESEAVA